MKTAHRWTGSLASFLDHLSRHFAKRVTIEQSPGDLEEFSDDEEAEVESMDADGPGVANGRLHGTRPALTPQTQQRVAKLIVKLASRSQYAKVSDRSGRITRTFRGSRGNLLKVAE